MAVPEFIRYPLLMKPFLSPRPWGGGRLARDLGKSIPDGETVGEAWELSDHPHGRSVIAAGPYAGESFGDLLRRFPSEMCGSATAPRRFPLIIKYIDAEGDLSIQVHPDDDAAAPHGEPGKTECWYVMDCAEDAHVIHGLGSGVTAADLEAELVSGQANGTVESMFRKVPIRRGSFVMMPAGTVHALRAGTLVCEVQRASDITWRLWDWGREPARELHIRDGIAAIRAAGPGGCEVIHTPEAAGCVSLAANPWFEIDLHCFAAGSSESVVLENPRGSILSVVEGEARAEFAGHAEGLATQSLAFGGTWYLPAGETRIAVRAGDRGVRLLVSRAAFH